MIGPDVHATARAWRDHPDWAELAQCGAPGVDWASVLVLALRHNLSQLLLDALDAAGVADNIPVMIAEELAFRSELVAARYTELVAALCELAAVEPAVIARSVLLKGGALMTEYDKPAYRPMNDFDVLFSNDDFVVLEPRFAQFGYWRKESLNGPTYYRNRDRPGGPLCIDVHVAGPSKYWRPDDALVKWLPDARPFTGPGGIACRRLPPELELLNVVTHIHEHLGSWIHALGDDDLALVRLFDVELLTQRRPIDVQRCWELAVEQKLQGEFALGLWAVAQVRGRLPDSLAALAPATDLVADTGELVALPGGEFAKWPVPLRERAYLINRTHLAFRVLRDGLPDPTRVNVADPDRIDAWRDWYRESGFKTELREHVEGLGARARERLAGFHPAAGRQPAPSH